MCVQVCVAVCERGSGCCMSAFDVRVSDDHVEGPKPSLPRGPESQTLPQQKFRQRSRLN